MAGISAWRVNDAVAYDLMRESATVLISSLVRLADRDASGSGQFRSEVADLRRRLVSVDAYDRAAVTVLTRAIEGRIDELSGASS